MICPRCSFQNRKGTLACARCGETAPKALGVVIDSRPPAEGPRAGGTVKGEIPRGQGLRALGGGPVWAPPPRIRQATPHWARSFPPRARRSEPTPAPPAAIGSAALSAVHQVITDPQWLVPPDRDPNEHDARRQFDTSAAEDSNEIGEPSTLGRRALAAIVDAAVIAFASASSLALGLAVFGWNAVAPQLGRGVDFVVDGLLVGRGLIFLLAALIVMIGFAYTTAAHALGGATLGKWLCGLKVVTREGDVPRPSESAWRAVLAGLSIAFAGIGVAVALVDPRHIALHDRLVGTRVVRADGSDEG